MESEGVYEGLFTCIDGSKKRILSFFTPVRKGEHGQVILIGSIDADIIRERFIMLAAYLSLFALAASLLAILLMRRQMKPIETQIQDQRNNFV